MSTNAAIIIKQGSVYKGIYVHSDGYLSYLGKLLLDHYNSASTKELIELGNASVVKKTPGESVFYVRDMGESMDDNDSFYSESLPEVLEYFDLFHYYLCVNDLWVYYEAGTKEWVELTHELIQKSKE